VQGRTGPSNLINAAELGTTGGFFYPVMVTATGDTSPYVDGTGPSAPAVRYQQSVIHPGGSSAGGSVSSGSFVARGDTASSITTSDAALMSNIGTFYSFFASTGGYTHRVYVSGGTIAHNEYVSNTQTQFQRGSNGDISIESLGAGYYVKAKHGSDAASAVVWTSNYFPNLSSTTAEVGCYAMCSRDNTATSFGATTAGSNLRYSNAAGSEPTNTTPPGTWRCMGDISSATGDASATVWLRIA
jgi:hypothetical protein